MSLLSENKGQYGFRVALTATKPEIKAEIEKCIQLKLLKLEL